MRLPAPSGVACCLLLLCVASPLGGQTAGDAGVACSFVRSTTVGEETDVARGRLYLWGAGRVTLHVEEPVRQVVSWCDSLAVVVYPDEKRAFVIRQSRGSVLDAFFPALAYKYFAQNLEDLGYRLERYQSVGDTSVLSWQRTARRGESGVPTSVVAKVVGDLPFVLSSRDARGREVSRVLFESYVKVGGVDIPLVTARSSSGEPARVSEVTVLSDPEWMCVLPREAWAPEVPADYEVSRYDFTGGN